MKKQHAHIVHAIAALIGLTLGPANRLFAQYPRLDYEKSMLEQMASLIDVGTQDSSIQYLGRWGWGMCRGVSTMGNYVLTGSGPTLLWLDVTDKRHPVIVWDTLTKASLSEFVIQDSIGYALVGSYSLLIVDLRNPEAPFITGELEIISQLLDLVVEGQFAFVKRFLGYVYCIDVSDPSFPYVRSIIRETSAQWGTLAISHSNLYVGDQNGFTEHADVSNPDSAIVTILYNLPFLVTAAYAKDTLLLLGNDSNRLYIYSIATPDSPTQLSNISIGTIGIVSVWLHGDTAFAGTLYGHIVAVDITDKTDPIILGRYIPPVFQPGLSARYLAVEDTALYCSYGNGMTAFSISDPGSMNVLSFFPTGHESNKVIVKDGLAYVTSGYGGVWVVDLSDPSRPRRVGNIQTPGYAYDVVVDSTIAYLSLNHPLYYANQDAWNGIWALDISRPESLRVLDTYTTRDPFAISKSGSLLFVTQNNNIGPPPETTLTVLDVSDPSDIRHMSSIVAGNAREITSRDSIAFVATSSEFGSPSGMKIFDCRDPVNPQVLSISFTNANGVSINGNHGYVHRVDSSFVVDITDLTAPIVLGGVRHLSPYFGGSWGSIVSNNRVFWATWGEIGVIEVSNPNEPRNLFETEFLSEEAGIDVVGDTVYVTSGGVWIFRFKGGMTSVEHVEQPIARTIHLFPNYPNPFNATTQLTFTAPTRQDVRIDVFNLLGQHVSTLFHGVVEAGEHKVEFDGKGLSSGIYVCRLSSDNASTTGRMILVK